MCVSDAFPIRFSLFSLMLTKCYTYTYTCIKVLRLFSMASFSSLSLLCASSPPPLIPISVSTVSRKSYDLM